MKNVKQDCRAALAAQLFREVIVEARLMTDKHACNPVYVAALAKELQSVEEYISAMERDLHIESARAESRPRPCRMPDNGPDARWIREVSGELCWRLHRLEAKHPTGLKIPTRRGKA